MIKMIVGFEFEEGDKVQVQLRNNEWVEGLVTSKEFCPPLYNLYYRVTYLNQGKTEGNWFWKMCVRQTQLAE